MFSSLITFPHCFRCVFMAALSFCIGKFFLLFYLSTVVLLLFDNNASLFVNAYERETSCYVGLTSKPPTVYYAEYIEAEYPQEYVISFPIQLCVNMKDVFTIALTVQKLAPDGNGHVGLPHMGDLPPSVTTSYTERLQKADQMYFIIVEDSKGGGSGSMADQSSHKLDIVIPKLTVNSSCQLEITFEFKGGVASYSSKSSWKGSLFVQQRPKIKDIAQHTIHNYKNDLILSDIICGDIVGNPKPLVTWSCAGNESFWIRKEKDGEKIYGPHRETKLTLYEFGDDTKCVGDARKMLVCKAESSLYENGKSDPKVYWDRKQIDVSQVINAADSDKSNCQDAKPNEDKVCADYLGSSKVQYNSTHRIDSFINILTFKSTLIGVDGGMSGATAKNSVCQRLMQNLMCHFYASDCRKRGEGLSCHQQCRAIFESCTSSPYLPTRNFCAYFKSQSPDTEPCKINFTTGLSLVQNHTEVPLQNNTAYNGQMSVANKNETCDMWSGSSTVVTSVHPSDYHLLSPLYEKNYCRAVKAPKNNNLYCFVRGKLTQCWPEILPPPSEKPPDLKRRCDFFCQVQALFQENWQVIGLAFLSFFTFLFLIAIFIYCCCCRRAPVRLLATDANAFPDMKLRNNPMYNPHQSRPTSGNANHPIMIGQDYHNNARFPHVVHASRNRYVSTPENSLGRTGAGGSATPSNLNFRFSGMTRGGSHSPAITPHAGATINRPVPVGMGYGSGGNRDPNPLLKYEYDRNKIQYIEDIGSGAFGYVFRAKAPGLGRAIGREVPFVGANNAAAVANVVGGGATGAGAESSLGGGIEVAVKMLKDDATEEQMADFVNEAKLMSSFNHPNIIKLLGVCSVGKPFCLLLEYMKNRDLSDFLRKNGPESNIDVKQRHNLSIADLILICQQVASGMSYISEKNYIHRDLATRNCLVSESMAVKISDFGLSQYIGTKEFLQVDDNDAIPIRWIAPEALHSNRYTKQSDVWAFGVLLWEVFSFATQPYVSMANIQDVVDYVTNGNHLNKPVRTPDDIYDVMCQCWNAEPSKRPNFRNLYEILDNLLKKYTSSQNDSYC